MLEDFTKVMSNGQVLPTSYTGSSKYAFSTYTLKVYQVHCIIYDSHNVLLRPLEYFRQVRGNQIMVKGRKSGQSISRPVWFVYQNNIVYLLPVNGSDTEWFKNVLHNPR